MPVDATGEALLDNNDCSGRSAAATTACETSISTPETGPDAVVTGSDQPNQYLEKELRRGGSEIRSGNPTFSLGHVRKSINKITTEDSYYNISSTAATNARRQSHFRHATCRREPATDIALDSFQASALAEREPLPASPTLQQHRDTNGAYARSGVYAQVGLDEAGHYNDVLRRPGRVSCANAATAARQHPHDTGRPSSTLRARTTRNNGYSRVPKEPWA